MTPAFVHLRVNAEYSLVNGVVRMKPLVNACAKAGMPAEAVTDQCYLFAMVKCYTAALSAGVTSLVGVDIWLLNVAEHILPRLLVLLCQVRSGFFNLTRLISRSYNEGQE